MHGEGVELVANKLIVLLQLLQGAEVLSSVYYGMVVEVLRGLELGAEESVIIGLHV